MQSDKKARTQRVWRHEPESNGKTPKIEFCRERSIFEHTEVEQSTISHRVQALEPSSRRIRRARSAVAIEGSFMVRAPNFQSDVRVCRVMPKIRHFGRREQPPNLDIMVKPKVLGPQGGQVGPGNGLVAESRGFWSCLKSATKLPNFDLTC